MLDILRSGGLNYGRVQVLVKPDDGADLANALAVATRLKAAGVKILLTLDYSDAPTSSTRQTTPAAWAGQSLGALTRTVHDYTESTVAAFAGNGTPVSEVSIGNDITQGILWPAGHLTVSPTGGTDWSPLTTLLKAGVQGARDGSPRADPPRIVLGIDSGADNATSVDFFDHMRAAGVPFDVIGEAYSPWSQGSMSALRANLLDLAARYHRPIVLAEGQFPYANITGYGDYSTSVPYPDTVPGYLISPAGQAGYERDLVSLIDSIPGHDGLGLFYSTPDTAGSLGWFTAAGAAQPAASAYRVDGGPAPAAGHAALDPHAPAVDVGPAAPAAPAALPAGGAAAATSGLPPLPAGLDAAIGARVSANSGSAPGTRLASVDDGDGTSYWTPSALGVHTVTIDLGRVTDITGTGITFSGEQAGDGAAYTVTTGVSRPGQSAFPHQAAQGGNPIAEGALYLFAGTPADAATTVRARYVTLTYEVPREEDISVQEFRVFSANAEQAAQLELGADLSTLISDNGTYTLDGTAEPILSIFRTGGLNYVRLRIWVNPGSPDCSPANCPDLANDLTMAKEIHAAGMKLLLDFHYSDTWADPQHQNVPAAWTGETLPQLASTIHDYTESVVKAFAANGTPADQVAIGNEITQGTLWSATKATTAAAAGATTVTVADARGIRAGDTLFVDAGVNLVPDQQTETATVAAVGTPGPAGTVITLASPLTMPHVGAFSVQDVQDSGKLLFDPTTDQADWTPLTTLLKAAADGALAGDPAGHTMLVQLHVDRGGDNATTTDWIEHMVAAGVPFDVIGESYYGWYHGSMATMKANLTALIEHFHKYVMIAEDQFPQAPQGGYGIYDAADANYPDTQPGYLVTPAGQASYQRDLNSIMASLPDGKGLGVFYWDADNQGNLGMFDTHHAAQPALFANQIGTATTTTVTTATTAGATTVTASVAAADAAPEGGPSGEVRLRVDGRPVGAPAALDAAGQATWTLDESDLGRGSHVITADYLGGWYFWTSRSAPVDRGIGTG